MTAPTRLLDARDLKMAYLSEGGVETPVLKGAALAVDSGESVAVVGPSGCGKSTLLNLLGGLDRPLSGTVELKGRDLAAMTDAELARVRNQEIGFVFQDHHLLPQLSLLENTLLPTLAGFPRPDDAESRARGLLERVGLSERADHLPGRVSGGERQRAAVVRALINAPALVLADEPTGALDEKTASALADLLVDINAEQNTALVVVTHSRELASRMGKLLRLEAGVLAPIQP